MDNPYADKEYIRRAQQDMTEQMYKQEILGELVDFNDDELPKGIKAEDMETIRKVSLEETSTRLGKIFKKFISTLDGYLLVISVLDDPIILLIIVSQFCFVPELFKIVVRVFSLSL